MKLSKLQKRRQAKKMHATMPLLGACWYTAATWEAMKTSAEDPELFEDSFSEWEAMAEETIINLSRQGLTLVKIFVSPEEFLTWCQAQGITNNSTSRAAFAGEALRTDPARYAS